MALIATSGFNGKNGTKFDLNLYYDIISQDISQNKTTIRYSLYFTSNSGYSGSGSTVTGKINGVPVGTTTSISARENKLMGTLDQTIEHNSDGTFPNTGYTAIIDTPWTLGDAEVAGTLTSANVPTIPRASSVSAGNGDINGLLGITIHRASDRFTHKLTYHYGNLTGDITQSAGDSYNWLVPDAFYTQIPEAREGIGTIHCYTMLDGNQVGNHTSCTFKVFTVENDCKPTVSATIVDTNKMLPTGVRTHTLTGSQDRLIKNISDVQVQINASPRKSAYLKSKKASCGDGQSGSGDSVVFYSVKSGSFTVYAQDSRDYTGYTNPSPIIKDMINYVPLTLNLNVYRPQPTTGEVSMDINGNYFNGSFGSINNSLEVKYRYKESGGSYPETYKTLTATIDTSNNKYSIHLDLGAEFDYQKSYDFEVIATDKVNIITKTYHVPEGIPMLGLFKNYIEMFGVDAFKTDGNKVTMNGDILVGKSAYKADKLVKEFIVPATNSKTFTVDVSDCDIDEDGGIWDVYFDGASTYGTLLYMRLNNVESLTQNLIESAGSSLIASNDGGKSRIGTVDQASTFIVAHISKPKGNIYARVVSHGGTLQNINTCIYETLVGEKLTSIVFDTSYHHLKQGTQVKIFRR